MRLRISAIVDNDSVGTKVRLNDGSYGIVTHGQAAPSVGMAVERGEFGYVIPVEGTRPHQTVDMGAIEDVIQNAGNFAMANLDGETFPGAGAEGTSSRWRTSYFIVDNDRDGMKENANAMESVRRDPKDQNRDYPEA